MGYLIYCMRFWITEPKAGAVTTPKAAVAAKGAAQKKKESSSSEDSSSDSEDEKPAKVHTRPSLCYVLLIVSHSAKCGV